MTPRRDFLEPGGTGCRIRIDASPGAAKSEIVGVNRWRAALQVRIAARPREGEANEELISVLSNALGVPRKDIKLLRGARSATKLIEVPLSIEETRDRLGV